MISLEILKITAQDDQIIGRLTERVERELEQIRTISPPTFKVKNEYLQQRINEMRSLLKQESCFLLESTADKSVGLDGIYVLIDGQVLIRVCLIDELEGYSHQYMVSRLEKLIERIEDINDAYERNFNFEIVSGLAKLSEIRPYSNFGVELIRFARDKISKQTLDRVRELKSVLS